MKQVNVWLYKTPWKLKKKYLINHLISIRTLSKYSHIEIEDCETGLCYTSTMRDEWNGTVKRPSAEVLRHPENWHCIVVWFKDDEYYSMFWWLDKEVEANEGYSKWDINKFLFPIHFADNVRNICSEIVNNALVIGRAILGFGIVSPGKVAKKLVKAGYVIKKGVKR